MDLYNKYGKINLKLFNYLYYVKIRTAVSPINKLHKTFEKFKLREA